MTNQLTFKIDKELVRMDLLLSADPSIPNAVRALNVAIPFVGMLGNEAVVVCLAEPKGYYHDLTYIAIDPFHQHKGYAKEIFEYIMNYARGGGIRYLEAGCGNAQISLITVYQRLGFRMTGVWTDYYLYDGRTATIENSIFNRDMIRFRIDLEEKTMSTMGMGMDF